MITTRNDLREYIREDQRVQPWPSNSLKKVIRMSGAVARWKAYMRKCEYHHNVPQNPYHKLAYIWYLLLLKDITVDSAQKWQLTYLEKALKSGIRRGLLLPNVYCRRLLLSF